MARIEDTEKKSWHDFSTKQTMSAGDRNKSGRPKDFVRHYGTERYPHRDYLMAICGNYRAGYVTDDHTDVTCLKCLKKLQEGIK